MKTWARKSLKVGVLSAGILLAAGNAAQADWNTSDNDGAVTGNQLLAGIDAPINISGNAVGVLGDAAAVSSTGGNRAGAQEAGELTTGDNGGAVTGNQLLVPVQIPVDVCGNAIAVLGDAAASCGAGGNGGGDYDKESGRAGNATTGNNGGLVTGNQLLASVTAPITITGNAVAVGGDAAAVAKGNGGGNGGGANEAGSWTTGDNDGLGTGNQVGAIVDVPVNVCGNAVAVLGDAAASCGGDKGNGGGEDGYGEGGRNRAESLPVGTGATALPQLTNVLPQAGDLLTGTRQAVSRDAGSGWNTGDNDGALTGNQVLLDVKLPLTIAKNAVAVAGDAAALQG
ncbi:MAG TPA: chaplin family protein [Pilimelia sp.]|nr:chaplin family protein [Pilimelia sp.]